MPVATTRRNVLRVAASLTYLAMTRRANADALPLVRIGLLPTDASTEIYVADGNGYYTRAGIRCEITTLSNGSAIAAALLSGSLDIGEINALSLIGAHERAVPLRIVAVGSECSTRAPLGEMIVLDGSRILSARDLKNMTVAVNSLKGIGEISAANWIDKNGGNAKSVNFIEMPFSLMAESLTAHRVDAALLQEPILTMTMVKGGMRSIGKPYASIAPRWMLGAWAATADWIESHTQIAEAFADATLQAGIWANHNSSKTAAMVSHTMRVPLDIARSMQRYAFVEKPNSSLVDPLIEVAVRYGMIAKPFPARDLFSSAALH
jgi:NitT/TauT family transport system substrate-binding protein